MTPKLIGDLDFEVTRRCNMCCEHCLRGDAQNLDISQEVATSVLDQFKEIRFLVFTGGEPSLNMAGLWMIFSEIKKRNIPIEAFFIATNGKEHQTELTMFCLDLLNYVSYPDCCAVCISTDIFHDNVDSPSPLRFLACYTHEKDNGNFNDFKSVIRRGRASEFQEGVDKSPICSICFSDEDEVENLEYDGLIYVSANGNLTADCDLSYQMIDSKDYGLKRTDGMAAANLEEFVRSIQPD